MKPNSLKISTALELPLDAVTQTIVVYGAKGMGKTNLISVLCEEFSRTGQKFAYLDPLGVGYGLRYAADGKGKGIENLVVLGGKHGDIPIEPTAGHVVADFVIKERVNVIIDISRLANGRVWKKGEKIRFCGDYFERLFERQGEKMYPMTQLVDEAARFIPQLIPSQSPDLARCVGAIEQVVEEGRNFGIGIVLVTQRSARMNKSVSELAECMVAFRTVGPNSISAIIDWLGEHIPKARHNEIVEKLRSLPRGSALVVSPGWLNFEGVVPVRMRYTFDSSATPTADQKLVTLRPLEAEKLEKYKAQMLATIEKAKADDPRELKRLNAELEKKVKTLESAGRPIKAVLGKTAPLRVQSVPFFNPGERKVIVALQKSIADIAMKVEKIFEGMIGKLAKVEKIALSKNNELHKFGQPAKPLPAIQSPQNDPRTRQYRFPQPAPLPHPLQPRIPPAFAKPVVAEVEPSGDMPVRPGAKVILIAVAGTGTDGASEAQIAVLTGYKRTSRKTYCKQLVAKGLMVRGGRGYVTTQEGIDWLGDDFEHLPTGLDLQQYWLNKLPDGELKLFKVYVERYPNEIKVDELQEVTGYKRTSVMTYRKHLIARNIVVGNRASENLFS